MESDALLRRIDLAALELFAGLSESALADVGALVRIRSVPGGTRIFDQGEPAARAHALLSGGVRISQAGSDGEQAVMRFIGPGEIFGSVILFTDRRYPADAVAMTDCVEASWSAADLMGLMERHARIPINMISVIGQRLARAQERLREISTQRVERRIAHILLRLARQAGRPVAGGVEIAFPLRRKDIADMTGTTLHTVSRVLSEWTRAGLVGTSSQHVTIRSLPALEGIADDDGAA